MAVFNESYLNEFLGIRFERNARHKNSSNNAINDPEVKKAINDITSKYKEAIRKEFKDSSILKDGSNSPKIIKGGKVFNIINHLFDIQWEEICKKCKVNSNNYERNHNKAMIIYKDDPNASKAYEECKNVLKQIKDTLKSVEQSLSDEYKGIATLDFWALVNPDDDDEYASFDDEYDIGNGEITLIINANKLIKSAVGESTLMESSNVITDRKTEFKKVISFLKPIVKEAKSKFGSDIGITICDNKWYNDPDQYWCVDQYEDFDEGGENEIIICKVDCYKNEKDYDSRSNDAYIFIINKMKETVKKSSDLNGKINSDGYKHDCMISYISFTKV